jgi:hypothetical protein
MNPSNAPNAQPDSTNRLKSIFEQSLAVLRGDKGDKNVRAGKVHKRCASLPLRMDAANLQKRAVEEAAKALASLWKISDPKRSKLQARAIQPNRSGF